MWEIIKSKDIDIYIGIATTILGLVLTMILDFFKNEKPSKQITNIKNQTHITITNINQIYNQRTPSGNQDDQGRKLFIGLALFSTGVFYLFFRRQVLSGLALSIPFIIYLWTGITLYSLVKGYFSGGRWVTNSLFSIAFCVAIIFISDKAEIPNYAPSYFSASQRIVETRGLNGLVQYMSPHDISWFLLHLVGLLISFAASIRMIFSAIYFSTMSAYIANNQTGNLPWLARKTAKYGNVFRNIVITSLYLLLSYFLVAGDAFMFLRYTFPSLINELIFTVLNGRR